MKLLKIKYKKCNFRYHCTVCGNILPSYSWEKPISYKVELTQKEYDLLLEKLKSLENNK